MLGFFHLLVMFVVNPFRSRRRVEIENLFLRHQLNIAVRRAPHRLGLRTSDRTLLILMTWLWPSLIGLSRVVRPETILRWHRAGFRTYWRWKSRSRPGRPKIERELRELIRRMSEENPLWGAPHIHGELLKLGFEVAESTVSKYMAKRRGPPSQGWRTFLRNHAEAIAAIDLCLVPPLTSSACLPFWSWAPVLLLRQSILKVEGTKITPVKRFKLSGHPGSIRMSEHTESQPADHRAATGQPRTSAIVSRRQDGSGQGLPAISKDPLRRQVRVIRFCVSRRNRARRLT
jgi:hypothetical protein